MERYHALSEATMDSLLESLESLVDGIADSNYEVEYHVRVKALQPVKVILTFRCQSGVLTLRLADKGTYVINKQPPNKQIWLSSPYRCVVHYLLAFPGSWYLSGPKRYDYCEAADDWLYSRDGRTMGELLNEELSQVFERQVNLKLTNVSKILLWCLQVVRRGNIADYTTCELLYAI